MAGCSSCGGSGYVLVNRHGSTSSGDVEWIFDAVLEPCYCYRGSLVKAATAARERLAARREEPANELMTLWKNRNAKSS